MKSTIELYKAILWLWIERTWYLTLSVLAFLIVYLVIYPVIFADEALTFVRRVGREKQRR